jgi:hypothetical protein
VSPEGPDPLGKRALFWAPAERVEESVRPGEYEPEDVGKYALFSRFSDVEEEEEPRLASAGVVGRPPIPTGLVPPVEVRCSSCGTARDVGLVEYMALHLPFFLWRPGRGFTRFMTCPACRRRTWVSASWTPWSAR